VYRFLKYVYIEYTTGKVGAGLIEVFMKFAILGCGHIATKMAAAVKTLEKKGMGVEAYAVASRSLEKAQKFADDSGSRLGKIREATQGYFTIEDRDSNTPQIKKVRVVTNVNYSLTK
jgi:hypothetical protein